MITFENEMRDLLTTARERLNERQASNMPDDFFQGAIDHIDMAVAMIDAKTRKDGEAAAQLAAQS